MSKKIKNCMIFSGYAAQDVTGSEIAINYNGKNILIECGMHQSSDILKAYNANIQKLPIKASKIDYVFVMHTHIDHIGRLPILFKRGFSGKIICTPETKVLAKDLLINSSYIAESDARHLSHKYHKVYQPLYDKYDVNTVMDYFVTYDTYNTIHTLDDTVSFQFFKNSHCVGACSLQLILNNGKETKKITYTSDLGAIHTNNSFVNNLDYKGITNTYSDIFIGESTYGDGKRDTKRLRSKDLEILKSTILNTLESGGCVLNPSFSFARTQEMLKCIYYMFSDNEEFGDTEVFVDSLLSTTMCEDYLKVLSGADLYEWKKIMGWKNLRFIKDKSDSISNISDKRPKVVISSSGFCMNGRVVDYLKSYIENENNTIIFSGFCGADKTYLGYRIKNAKPNEIINIDGKGYKNAAHVVNLVTFSSHADFADLNEIYSNLKTNKLVLVHGSEQAKINLKNSLEQRISKNNKTYKVVCATKGMVINL